MTTGRAPRTSARVSDLDALTRLSERGREDRSELDAVLDSMMFGTLSTVVDGEPWAIPMLYARRGDDILLHGSSGGGALRQVAAGIPAAFSVAQLDGIVVADHLFEHSANYRSAVVRGTATALDADQAADALVALSGTLLPGRPDELVGTTRKERAATLTLRLPIEPGRWIVKVRSGPSGPASRDPDAWRGVVPLNQVWGTPEPDTDLSPGIPLPESVRALIQP